jgi:hypothetical protein
MGKKYKHRSRSRSLSSVSSRSERRKRSRSNSRKRDRKEPKHKTTKNSDNSIEKPKQIELLTEEEYLLKSFGINDFDTTKVKYVYIE